MTTEISSAPELIYYCEFNPENWDNRLDITFSKEHIVLSELLSFDKGKVEIDIDIQFKDLCIPSDFFGNNISNIVAIAGKNGVGKSNVLKGIFSNRNYAPYESFTIYKIKDFTYLVELSDIDNICIKNSFTDSRFELYTTQDRYLDPGIGKYDREDRISNSLIVGMNIYEKNIIEKDLHYRKRIFIYKRVFADSRESEIIELLKDPFFSENFFGKDTFPIIYTTDIVDFYLRDYYFYERNIYFCVKSEVLENLRNKGSEELKELFLLYFLIKSLSALSPKSVSNNPISNAKSLSVKDTIEMLKRIIKNIKFRYRICYPYFTHEKELPYELILRIFQLLDSVVKGNLKVIRNRLEYTISDFKYIDYGDRHIDCIAVLLNDLDHLNKAVGMTVLGVSVGGYSSGEKYIIEQFSSLRKVLDNEVIQPHLLMETKRFNSIIVLIDEYEQFLHPEWSRKYLKFLIRFLEIEGQRLDIKIQVIITTHSPYLISDLPKENIRLIKKDEKTEKREVSIPKHSFASNYYDILSDSFFLEDTIGEFAKQKIQSWIKQLNDLEGLALSDRKKLAKVDEISELIKIVDDQFMQDKLLELAKDVRNNILKKADKALQASLIDEEIAKLEAMKKQLNQEDIQDD